MLKITKKNNKNKTKKNQINDSKKNTKEIN